MSLTDDRKRVSRRTVAKGAAWAAPAIVMMGEAPRAAASSPTAPKAFSSWGVTWYCSSSHNCGSGTATYSWYIDNTSGSGLSYHGVLFPNASVGQIYSNVINIYWLPFATGTSTQTSGSQQWSNLTLQSSTYGTITGPNNKTYYPWVTTLAGPVTVAAGQVDSNGVFHLTPDYKFTFTSPSCVSSPLYGGDLYVSHSYYADLNGSPLPCSSSYNGNYCGQTTAYPGHGDSQAGWRNNGWVGVPSGGWGYCGSGSNSMSSKKVGSQSSISTSSSNNTPADVGGIAYV